MGGKAYVGGTAYDITGGKTLVGGTAYDITTGKTLIGGTAYDINFKPTLIKLFASIDSFDRWGQDSRSATTYPGSTTSTYPAPEDSTLPVPQVGDTWFLFYAVGNSLEISRIELLTSTTMSKRTIRKVGTNNYVSVLNNNSTGIYGSSPTYAGNFIYLHFNTSPNSVEQIFTQCNISIEKGYASSGVTNTTGNLGISTSTSFSGGILFPIFSNLSSSSSSATKTTLWGAIDATNPTGSAIVAGSNASFVTNRSLLVTSSSYYMPSRDGTNVVQYVRGYTLVHFSET